MRLAPILLALALPPAVASCKGKPAATELTRHQCVDLVRKEHRLRSAGTSGLEMAEQVGERAGVDACLGKATQSAYRCVMHAETAGDLGACDELMK
jgi:hypothetical protein